AASDDGDKVNQRPDAAAASRQQLRDAGAGLANIEAMDSQVANKQTEQQRRQPVLLADNHHRLHGLHRLHLLPVRLAKLLGLLPILWLGTVLGLRLRTILWLLPIGLGTIGLLGLSGLHKLLSPLVIESGVTRPARIHQMFAEPHRSRRLPESISHK